MKTRMPPVKFLLVDDLEENLVALEALLVRDGLEILMARSGREALELLLTHDVALALVDVQMPDMDGFELAELMRGTARTRAVPIIFVTAGTSEANRVFKGYDAGAVDFLHKPVDPRILWHKTETFFQLERQRQQLAETLRLNETFVAAVGHDLRNPLSAIMTGVQILEMTATDDRTKATVARLRSSGKRMSAIIDDLFDLARARVGGGIGIQPSQTDLLAIVQRVVAEHQQAHPRRPIDVTSHGPTSGEWDPSGGSSRWSRTSSGTPSATAPATQPSRCGSRRRGSDEVAWSSRSTTPARSPRRSCRTSSIRSVRAARTRRVARASGSGSSSRTRSSRRTAAASKWSRPKPPERPSACGFPGRRPPTLPARREPSATGAATGA